MDDLGNLITVNVTGRIRDLNDYTDLQGVTVTMVYNGYVR